MKENKVKIDEMKLHKLMYFAQRESFVQNDAPLFNEEFEAWKYGPVLREIRAHYRANDFIDYDDEQLTPIMDRVFEEYSHIMSWSLSMISHSEESWQRAREGVPDGINSNRKIKTEDIRIDAQRVKESRGIVAC
jgi:uncharacterized phage-associated protein